MCGCARSERFPTKVFNFGIEDMCNAFLLCFWGRRERARETERERERARGERARARARENRSWILNTSCH